MTGAYNRTKRLALDTAVISALLLGYGAGYVFGCAGRYYLSGAAIVGMALLLALLFYFRNGTLLDPELVFSLFWFGGAGLSALKLSRLAQDWTWESWAAFFLVYVFFLAGYELLRLLLPRREGRGDVPQRSEAETERLQNLLVALIAGTTIVASLCFLYEAWRLTLIPLFSSKPHAYSEFHISGVHYFTVSCVLVPALAVLYFMLGKDRERKPSWFEKGLVLLLCAMSLAIPVLAVSRFQLILSVTLAVVSWLSLEEKRQKELLSAPRKEEGLEETQEGIRKEKQKGRKRHAGLILLLLLAMIPLYVGLTVARNHDVEYLNGIFEMKNEKTPIFITQPYMYIANNYDNFNCLTWAPFTHTEGLRMAYPVIVLTGQKFRHPEWVDFPIYVTKTELTTVTLIYDAYYDFGLAGVAGFGFGLGLFGAFVTWLSRRSRNPVGALFFAQALTYFALSFFTTWYSNPATWFYYGLTVLYFGVLLVGNRRKERMRKE